MFVKICGITNASDALLAVAMGAEVLGFVFADSKRQVTPEQAGEIIQQLPYDVTAVGVFRNQHPDQILDVISVARLSGVQLHGQETPGSLPQRRRVILAGGLTPENVREAVQAVRPWGVDVASGVESSPGQKDPVALRRFIAEATNALSEFSIDPKHA